jgi:peptidoglycan/LPS O-acetylase OafA/YrhL
MNMNSPRLQFLDGLRGVAALTVTIAHCYRLLEGKGYLRQELGYLIDAILKQGHIGVEVFFVLSGFVITYSIRNSSINFSFLFNFILRRSIRLDPPYWTILAFLISLSFIGQYTFVKSESSIPTAWQSLANMFYLQDILSVKTILPVAWTLCIELQFYLAFISLLALISWLNEKVFLSPNPSLYQSPSFFSIFGLLGLLSLGQHIQISPFLPGLFIPYWYSFFIGCLTCLTITRLQSSKFFWIYFALIGSTLYFNFNLNDVIILAAALAIFLAGHYGKFNQWLISKPFQYTGKISYSLYLIHWPIGMKLIDTMLRLLGNEVNFITALVLFIASISLSLIAAHFFYTWIEYPFMKWSQKFKKTAEQPLQVTDIKSISCI